MDLAKLKKISLDKKIPILRDKSAKYILNFLKKNNIINLLEIGSALGYSSLYFSNNNPALMIDSIEKDNKRFLFCEKYINNKRINFINCCAYEFLSEKKYDCIFIDGPKSKQNILFEKYSELLNDKGYIIIDNIFLKDINLISKNNIKLKEKNLKFQEYLKNIKNWKIKIIDIEDGIAICNRK